jgi:hypothetical protein
MKRHDCPYCTDRNGRSKKLYQSHLEATKTAEYIHRERGVQLRVYRCNYTSGFHLTSDLARCW